MSDENEILITSNTSPALVPLEQLKATLLGVAETARNLNLVLASIGLDAKGLGGSVASIKTVQSAYKIAADDIADKQKRINNLLGVKDDERLIGEKRTRYESAFGKLLNDGERRLEQSAKLGQKFFNNLLGVDDARLEGAARTRYESSFGKLLNTGEQQLAKSAKLGQQYFNNLLGVSDARLEGASRTRYESAFGKLLNTGEQQLAKSAKLGQQYFNNLLGVSDNRLEGTARTRYESSFGQLLNTGDRQLEKSAKLGQKFFNNLLGVSDARLEGAARTRYENMFGGLLSAADRAARATPQGVVQTAMDRLNRDRVSFNDPNYRQQHRELQQERRHDALFGDGGAFMLGLQARILMGYQALNMLIGGFTGGVAAVVEFDQALRNLQAITNTSETDMVGLKAAIMETGTATKFTSLELAQAATVLGQAGLNAREIAEALPAIAKLASGAGATMAQATDIATAALGGFQLQATEIPKAVDVMTAALNRSKLDTEKLALGIQYAGNVAHETGTSFTEFTALLATAANAGIRSGSTIGTGIRQLYNEFQAPQEKFLERVKQLGLSQDQISVKTQGFAGVLKNLKDAGFTAADAMETMELRGANMYTALSKNVETIDDMQKQLLLSSAASEANDTQMKGLANTIRNLLSILQNLAVQFGEDIVRAIQRAVETLNVMLKALSDNGWWLKYVGDVGFGLMVAGIGRMIARLIIGSGAITAMSAAMRVLTASTTSAAAATTALSTAMRGNLAFLAVSVAVTALTAGFGTFADAVQLADDKLDQQKSKMDAASSKYDTTTNTLEALNEAIRDLGNRHERLTRNSGELGVAVEEARQKFGNLDNRLQGNITTFNQLIDVLGKVREKLNMDKVIDSNAMEVEIQNTIAALRVKAAAALGRDSLTLSGANLPGQFLTAKAVGFGMGANVTSSLDPNKITDPAGQAAVIKAIALLQQGYTGKDQQRIDVASTYNDLNNLSKSLSTDNPLRQVYEYYRVMLDDARKVLGDISAETLRLANQQRTTQGAVGALIDSGQQQATTARAPLTGLPRGKTMGQVNAVNSYNGFINQYAAKYGVDPDMIRALMLIESGGDPNAKSPTGVRGLMQVTSENMTRFGLTNRLDPAQSIEAGVRVFQEALMRNNGNVSAAFNEYNLGAGAARTKTNVDYVTKANEALSFFKNGYAPLPTTATPPGVENFMGNTEARQIKLNELMASLQAGKLTLQEHQVLADQINKIVEEEKDAWTRRTADGVVEKPGEALTTAHTNLMSSASKALKDAEEASFKGFEEEFKTRKAAYEKAIKSLQSTKAMQPTEADNLIQLVGDQLGEVGYNVNPALLDRNGVDRIMLDLRSAMLSLQTQHGQRTAAKNNKTQDPATILAQANEAAELQLQYDRDNARDKEETERVRRELRVKEYEKEKTVRTAELETLKARLKRPKSDDDFAAIQSGMMGAVDALQALDEAIANETNAKYSPAEKATLLASVQARYMETRAKMREELDGELDRWKAMKVKQSGMDVDSTKLAMQLTEYREAKAAEARNRNITSLENRKSTLNSAAELHPEYSTLFELEILRTEEKIREAKKETAQADLDGVNAMRAKLEEHQKAIQAAIMQRDIAADIKAAESDLQTAKASGDTTSVTRAQERLNKLKKEALDDDKTTQELQTRINDLLDKAAGLEAQIKASKETKNASLGQLLYAEIEAVVESSPEKTRTMAQTMASTFGAGIKAMKGDLGSFIADLVTGTEKGTSAFRNFANAILKAMLNVVTSEVATGFLKLALSFAGSLISGGTSAETGNVDMSKVGVGANASGPDAALLSKISYPRASGGPVDGPIPNKDSVLTPTMPGEWVIKKSSVDAVGQDFMKRFNEDSVSALSSLTPVVNVASQSNEGGTVNVYVVSKDSVPTLGAKDVVAIVTDDMAKGGQTKKLVKSIAMGAV